MGPRPPDHRLQLAAYALLVEEVFERGPECLHLYLASAGDSVLRDAQLLGAESVEGDELAGQRLALWTILALRWPLLADALGRRPELIRPLVIGVAPGEGLPDDLRRLLDDPDVQRVVRGEGVDAALDEASLTAFARDLTVGAADSPRRGPGLRRRIRDRAGGAAPGRAR